MTTTMDPSSPAERAVLVIGDSFVEGVGATDNNGWAQQLIQQLGSGVASGIGGDTIVSLLKRLGPELSATYSLVIVEVGLNDSRYRPSVGHREVEESEFVLVYSQVIERVAPIGKHVCLMGLTRVDEARTAPFKEDKFHYNRDIEIYDRLIDDLAGAQSLTFIPVPSLLETPGLLSDGVHPSNQGHAVLRSAVVAGLKQWIS